MHAVDDQARRARGIPAWADTTGPAFVEVEEGATLLGRNAPSRVAILRLHRDVTRPTDRHLRRVSVLLCGERKLDSSFGTHTFDGCQSGDTRADDGTAEVVGSEPRRLGPQLVRSDSHHDVAH